MNSLQATLDRLGISIAAEAVTKLTRYRDLLLDANRRFNLTAITSPADVDERLVAASLALLSLLPSDAATLLDVGTGGGIPGIPLAIARPELRVTLLDATAKKVRFLEDVIQELGLSNASAVWGRAEDLGHDPTHRERYAVVTARAVARLVTLAEFTLPFARVGGVVLLPKGAGAQDELDEARYAVRILGGSARPLDGSTVVVLDKQTLTAPAYPRRPGIPAKSPLMPKSRRQNAR